MQINHKAFYDGVRRPLFNGAMTALQVAGMEALLNAWENRYQTRTSLPQFADVLATPYWETSRKMQPVNELGNDAYFHRMYDINGARPNVARSLGNTQPGDGTFFHGRGLVQLTGRALYLRATQRLRALNVLKPTESLVTNPDLALRDDIAVALLFEGMEGGWFTGRTLDEEIDDDIDGDEHADFIRARAIINGKDRAVQIAVYADQFLRALRNATLH